MELLSHVLVFVIGFALGVFFVGASVVGTLWKRKRP
jgi:hypothetical protein